MNHLLTITDVIARTGERTTQFTVPGHALVDNGQLSEAKVNEAEGSRRFLVLTIPKTFGQFVTIVPNLPSDQYRRGQDAREYVGALAQASREVLAANNFVVVLIQTPLKLDMFVTVNTDHPELIKEIDARERASVGPRAQQAEFKPFQIGVNVVVVGENEKTAKSERKLDLQLLPLRQKRKLNLMSS